MEPFKSARPGYAKLVQEMHQERNNFSNQPFLTLIMDYAIFIFSLR
jgi:hypothetical protein